MKMDTCIRDFFKNSLVSSGEVRASEDISETQAVEDNAAQISGINNKTECSVAMATIQKRRVCIVKKRKWNNNYIAYVFFAQKRGFEPLSFGALSVLHSCLW